MKYNSFPITISFGATTFICPRKNYNNKKNRRCPAMKMSEICMNGFFRASWLFLQNFCQKNEQYTQQIVESLLLQYSKFLTTN